MVTATLTASSTPTPYRIYLPFTEKTKPCDPDAYRSSVVLVLDRSTSMLRPVEAGGIPKNEAAIEAAKRFLAFLQLDDGGHRVEAHIPMPLSLGRVISDEDWMIHVVAEAQANASPPIEVALVLDNTGSMRNDMQALRDAAEDLADSLLNLDGDTVHVALVPFVAQVNIGNGALQRGWLDQAGLAAYNGELLEDRSIAHMPVETRRNRAGYTGADCEALSTLPYAAYTGPYRIVWRKSSSLLGGARCYAFVPEGVNYVALHDLISNSSWKGCVEARPEPYDISDSAPVAATPPAPRR